jgi:hypothetical protein
MSVGGKNKTISPVCRALTEDNLERLPPRYTFRPGEATYEAIQEVFWACAVEVISKLLGLVDLPDQIRVGKEQIPLEITRGQWQQFQAELDLDQTPVREAVRSVLCGQFLHQEGQGLPWAGPLAQHLSPRLLGLVLLICHLDRLGEHGPPRSFAYEFHELTRLARCTLTWVPVGEFDEGQVARHLFDYVGIRIHASDRMLRIPYHAFTRPLRARLGRGAASPGQTPEKELPSDFLLKSLPAVASSEPGTQRSGVSGSSELGTQHSGVSGPSPLDSRLATLDSKAERAWLLEELNHLRAENDRLRLFDPAGLLSGLMAPLLTGSEQPGTTLEHVLPDCPPLVQDLLGAVLHLCRSPDLEFVGEPGQVISLTLPHPAHCLDESAPPARRDISSGWFQVSRRGVRLRGQILVPIRVIPTASPCREPMTQGPGIRGGPPREGQSEARESPSENTPT